MSLAEFDTPALFLDLDKAERNLDRMAQLFASSHVRVRPHAKTHKSPILARMQIDRGAAGVCCAKLGEAEVLADGGIENILVTTELVGTAKIERLLALAKRIRVTIVVDGEAAARALSDAAVRAGIRLRTLVDLDVGQHRTGTPTVADAVRVGTLIASLAGLEPAGIQGYEGHLQHVEDARARKAAVGEAMALLGEAVRAFGAAGLSTGVVTTAGTGTALFAATHSFVTEVQPGSYVMMDAQYGAVEGVDFEHALTLATTVVSTADGTAIVDAGFKSLGSDAGQPAPLGIAATFSFAGDEHGKLTFTGPRTLETGAVLEVVPGHCDTTINLHDTYVVHRSGTVVDRWPVAARGKTR